MWWSGPGRGRGQVRLKIINENNNNNNNSSNTSSNNKYIITRRSVVGPFAPARARAWGRLI